MTSTAVPSRPAYEFSRAPRGRPFAAPSTPTGPPAGNAGPQRTTLERPRQSQQRPSEMTLLQARAEEARIRLEAFTAGPVAAMRRDMAQRVARQSLNRVEAVDATRSSWPLSHVPSTLPPVEEEKSYSSEWQHDDAHGVRSLRPTRDIGVAEEKNQSTISTVRTVLHNEEVEQLKRYHDNSLADSTRRAYQSDYDRLLGSGAGEVGHIYYYRGADPTDYPPSTAELHRSTVPSTPFTRLTLHLSPLLFASFHLPLLRGPSTRAFA